MSVECRPLGLAGTELSGLSMIWGPLMRRGRDGSRSITGIPLRRYGVPFNCSIECCSVFGFVFLVNPFRLNADAQGDRYLRSSLVHSKTPIEFCAMMDVAVVQLYNLHLMVECSMLSCNCSLYIKCIYAVYGSVSTVPSNFRLYTTILPKKSELSSKTSLRL
jgi:hypothetical protein